MLTNVREILGVDLTTDDGLVVRFTSSEGKEHHLHFSGKEGQALADMLAIAITHRPATRVRPNA